MTYSFASLHSACLENNEGVCCFNLCNGEREEGWDGRGAVKEEGVEEKSDELMLLHCSSSIHTLHLVVFMPCARSCTCTDSYRQFVCNTRVYWSIHICAHM